MSPAEDALLLLAIVRRHLRALRFGLDGAYPEEDWGFTAQQAVEKLLKAWIVLADRQPPIHGLDPSADWLIEHRSNLIGNLPASGQILNDVYQQLHLIQTAAA